MNMSKETPDFLPWADKQIREWVDAVKNSTNLKKDLELLQVSVVISFLKSNSNVLFSQSEGGTPKNSAAIVAMLQRAMNLLEFPIKIDGLMTMGGETTLAIAKFQKKYMAGGNGVPGPRTIAKIVEELEKLRAGGEAENNPLIEGRKIVDELKRSALTDKGVKKAKDGSIWLGSEQNASYALIQEQDAVSVWGKIDASTNTRKLIILGKDGKEVVYSGILSQNSNLQDVGGKFPENLKRNQYKFMPNIINNMVSSSK